MEYNFLIKIFDSATTKLIWKNVNIPTLFRYINIDNFRESEDCELNKDSLPRLMVLSGRTVEGLQSVFMKVSYSILQMIIKFFDFI